MLLASTAEGAAKRKRALLVGAYERDNFGDELFLLVTEYFLAEAGFECVAAAPFAADMSALLDRPVVRFVDRLESERFDLVWTVGGEAGAIGTDTAMRWSVAPDTFARFEAADAAGRAKIRREAMGSTPVETPYMPRLSAFPKNVLTPTVINSIGMGSIAKASTDRKAQVFRVLREATSVSVRDPNSSASLQSAGIEHTLRPDLVHTIRNAHPRPAGEAGSGYALVQVNQAQITSIGLTRFADAVAASKALRPYPLRLFFAGKAAGHDSPEQYRQIRERILQQDPDRDIEILDGSRRPWDLVDEIRRAALWFGASLHGRIVASAYDVPRISLARGKVDTYAKTWDAEMPWRIKIDQLDDAVRSALSSRTTTRAAGTGERLAGLAEANIRDLISRAVDATPEQIALSRARAQEPDQLVFRRERDNALKQRNQARAELDRARSERDGARTQRNQALRERDAAKQDVAQRLTWKALRSKLASTTLGRRAAKVVKKARQSKSTIS